MSPRNNGTSTHNGQQPKTIDEACGPLTQQAVDGAADATTKNTLQTARNMAVGLATLFLDGDNPQDKAVVELFGKVNIDLGQVQQLAALGAALLTAEADRNEAEAQARASDARYETARDKLHDACISFANLARGTLGAQSPALEKFGIKSIGGRRGIKRASRKNGDKKDAGSGSDSGNGQGDAGASKKS